VLCDERMISRSGGTTGRRGQVVGRMPIRRWARPTALLQNAGAYSDGSIFPQL
jgi:tricorn protease